MKRFAQSKGAKYPLFAKIEVNGNNAHPLYKWLKAQKGAVFGIEVPVKWNFEKARYCRCCAVSASSSQRVTDLLRHQPLPGALRQSRGGR